MTVAGNTSYHNAYQYQRNANGIDDIAPGNSIIGNVTYANEDTGINIYTGGNNALVANNVTYDNGDHGIDDFNVTGGRIIGNTVYFNCTDGINVEGTSGNYDIENNVSVNNATGAVINPTPIPTNPSTGQPYYTNTCNRRIGNIGVYDSAPAEHHGQLQPRIPERRGRRYTWAGTTYNSQSALQHRDRAGVGRKFAEPAVRQRRGVEPPAQRRIPGHRLGECRSPRVSSRPTSWAIRAPTTRTPRTPATRRGRTPTVARTSSSPAAEAGHANPADGGPDGSRRRRAPRRSR